MPPKLGGIGSFRIDALLGLASGLALDFSGPKPEAYPVVTASALRDDPSVHVTVLIVDDHRAFRASARTLLELDGFDVVGEASDGASALELVQELEPELVLLDVSLPDTTGFELAEQLSGSPSKVILTSSRERRDLGDRVRRTGALGFLPKEHLSGPTIRALLGDRS